MSRIIDSRGGSIVVVPHTKPFIDYVGEEKGSPCHECLIGTMCHRRFFDDSVCDSFIKFYNKFILKFKDGQNASERPMSEVFGKPNVFKNVPKKTRLLEDQS